MAIAKFEVPKELADKVYEAVTLAKTNGKVSKGVNETTKAIERGIAKLVIIATDVSPEEVVMHLPLLCDEKQIPYVFVPSREELGVSAGIGVQTSSIAITEEGESKKHIEEIAAEVTKLKGK
ncbi:MAG: 50S ribosomal protein L7ae [Candidatus Aenigmarchaeota archaeon]|nr:50S ribosomal protein L7ae [Candidatus Aenigmarchaeota archaeon]